MTSKRIFRLSAYIVLACLLASCQADDILVQSPFGLSGAPLRYNDSEASKFLEVAAEFYGGISIIN